jgi:hypothetical protein
MENHAPKPDDPKPKVVDPFSVDPRSVDSFSVADLLPLPYISEKPKTTSLGKTAASLKTNLLCLPTTQKPKRPAVARTMQPVPTPEMILSLKVNLPNDCFESDQDSDDQEEKTVCPPSPGKLESQETPPLITSFCENYIKQTLPEGDLRYAKFLRTIRLCNTESKKKTKRSRRL